MMKIDKNVPIPARMPRNKTAFVKDMKVGDSILCSGGFQGVEAKRVIGALRRYGYRGLSRIVPGTGHGDDADVRVWRVEGSPKTRGPHRPREKGKVTGSTRAGKKGKIIECPECAHRMVMSNFAWSKIVCLGCRAEIKKTDCLLPKLSKRQEAKVRTTYEAEQFLDVDTPVELECKEHGGFMMTPNNHMGDNPEKIAYGCPTCSKDRVQRFCELKVENLGCSLDDNPYEYITTFNTLYNILKAGNGQLASQIGEMSHDGIVALAKDSRLNGLLKGKKDEHPIK